MIDEGNREGLRIEVGTSITAARVVRVMNELIECYGKPKAIRLDNGAELRAQVFVDWAEENEVQLRFIQPGKPNQNAFIERFNKSYREEVLDANLFNTLTEVQAATDEWVMDYNEFRPHEHWVVCRPQHLCHEFLNRKSLFLTCSLDREVYDLKLHKKSIFFL